MPDTPTLVRAIGRWSLAALVLNGVIGSAVFVLPGTIAGTLGWAALAAWVIAALCIAAMVFCFAEVSSRFTGAGGAYLYARAAFGGFVGIQIGWLTYLARCISAAVQANLFSTYLAEIWPWAGTRAGEVAATTAIIGLHAAVNVRGVGSGARVSNVFAVVKLAPLLAFGALGIGWLALGNASTPPVASDPTLGGWLGALLLLMFAYGGFESALIPLAEAKDPRRDAPFALLLGLGLVTVVYLAAQVTVLATLSDPAATNRPLAGSARVMLGATGAVLITVTALLSVYGWLASNMLNVPRLTMAMAHEGELPAFFGRLHPAWRTPWISILVFAGISWALALQAGLLQNLSLAAVSRLFPYAAVCLSLIVFRRRDRRGAGGVAGPAQFPVRAGNLLAVLGTVVSLVLASRMGTREAVALGITAAVAAAHWLALRNSSNQSRVSDSRAG